MSHARGRVRPSRDENWRWEPGSEPELGLCQVTHCGNPLRLLWPGPDSGGGILCAIPSPFMAYLF